MPERTMKAGNAMAAALVDWNRQHFQQPISNVATTANGGIFS